MRFLSTLSLRRATQGHKCHCIRSKFLSTLSLRRATASTTTITTCIASFLSTLSLRRATKTKMTGPERPGISIHALLAESDKRLCTILYSCPDFYPRSPCGERRSNPPVTMRTWQFLSTLSLRRATLRLMFSWLSGRLFLSTLSLRRATLFFCRDAAKSRYFYPRSPCGERPSIVVPPKADKAFLSTLSLRRATIIFLP